MEPGRLTRFIVYLLVNNVAISIQTTNTSLAPVSQQPNDVTRPTAQRSSPSIPETNPTAPPSVPEKVVEVQSVDILYPSENNVAIEEILFSELVDKTHNCTNYAYYQVFHVERENIAACNTTKYLNATYVKRRYDFDISAAHETFHYVSIKQSWKYCKYLFIQQNCLHTKIRCDYKGECYNVNENVDFDLSASLISIGKTTISVFINFAVFGGTIATIIALKKTLAKHRENPKDGENYIVHRRKYAQGEPMAENLRYNYHTEM